MGACHGTTATVDIDHHQSSVVMSSRRLSNDSRRSNSGEGMMPALANTEAVPSSSATTASFQSSTMHSSAQTTTTTTSSSSVMMAFQEDCAVDPADIITIIDERASHTINQFTSAEVLQIQRHVRAVARTVRGMPAAAALINMGRAATATSLLPNTKTGLSKHSMDEAVLRRIFATGADHFQRGSTELKEWKKKRNAHSSLLIQNASPPSAEANANLFDIFSTTTTKTTTHELFQQPCITGKYKADPVGSVYLLLLACAEVRWESYAAASAAIAAKTTGDGSSRAALTTLLSTLDAKNKRKSGSNGIVPFRNNGSNTESNYDDSGSSSVVPNGISFFMLCYFMAIATKSTNREQKLLLLFHILVPPKQLKITFFSSQQQASSNIFPNRLFPSYMFEVGVTTTSSQPNKEILLSVTSAEAHPSKLGLKVSSAVTIDTIASLLLISSMIGTCGSGTDGSEPGKEDQLEATMAKLVALYESVTTDQLWSYDDFIRWCSVALDDDMIDSILQTLFSEGIFASPEQELQMVRERWRKWQHNEYERRHNNIPSLLDDPAVVATKEKTEIETNSPQKSLSGIWGRSVNGANSSSSSNAVVEPTPAASNGNDVLLGPERKTKKVWGGIGNFDDLGGLGNGVLYCIDIHWWKSWEKYSGWQWGSTWAEPNTGRHISSSSKQRRPGALSTESLLQKNNELVGGVLGSYETMKSGLQKNIDYILIPCSVWDLLFELYGGGPPLPRMVDIPISSSDDEISSFSNNNLDTSDYLASIPLSVVTHPWIIHCQICDPIQPYRRGNAGSFTIRVMVTPDQPFWRFFAEIVLRLPVNHARARDINGKGKARMWRKVDSFINGEEQSDLSGASRYGPWSLLCKGRSALIPVDMSVFNLAEFCSQYQNEWLKYADHGTIESSGLSDGMEVMFEYSLVGKDGTFCWPREAAAKAGRARRLAEEDSQFRLKLQCLDKRGNLTHERIVGTVVDAMDFTGRWYPAEIVDVERNSPKMSGKTRYSTQEDNSEYFEGGEEAEQISDLSGFLGNRRVKVDFGESLFLEEWIDVDSDRIAVAGRFTSDGIKSLESHDDSDSKSANNSLRKNGGVNETSAVENGVVCPFPGYGACGLVNLGNTCYMSVALQCISYMPFVRAYLLGSLYKSTGDLNRDNPLGTGGKILDEMSELMRLMWSGRYGARSPTRFRSVLAKTRSQFVGTEQQDAQELLNSLIDSLHEDSNRIKSKPVGPPLDDSWVKKNDLARVGLEAWRRFLRRNRSVITDTAMGQVLNRVVCPSCAHSSLNFDPFNMLSIPFPAVTDIIFRCTLIRRGTSLNCQALCRKKNMSQLSSSTIALAQHQQIMEVFTIKMPRLADISDLKHRLEKVSGVAANRIRLWKGEKMEVTHRANRKLLPGTSFVKITILPNKEGPCVQLTKQSEREETSSLPVNEIYAFEETLNLRVIQVSQRHGGYDDEFGNEDEDTVESDDGEQLQMSYRERVQDDLLDYGDNLECFMVDSDPSAIARAVSRCLWPKNGLDFKLGLRVDAIDQRGHWFPGSVVEITDVQSLDSDVAENNIEVSKKVRLHFDNFSSKWDEWYDFTDFCNSQVTPLYSHSTPRMKPTEVIAYHRLGISHARKGSEIASGDSDAALFGQAFCIQFFNEWSTARAGAHILAQAARFLRSSEHAVSHSLSTDRLNDTSELASVAITEAIDVLIESEINYIKCALSQGNNTDGNVNNITFDAAAMTSSLSEKLGSLLPRLPFDVRVCSVDSLMGKAVGGESEETAFPFSLVRTVGNYLNSRNAILLHWRNVRLDKATLKKSPHSPERSIDHFDDGLVAYKNPGIRIHSDDSNPHKAKSAASSDGGTAYSTETSLTMNIGVCLTEFCREQKLLLADGWFCPKCKDFREGLQSMSLWRLPDILTLHIKRFNCSARWREKISTNINFPLTGLDMSQWCDKESLVHKNAGGGQSTYDLIAVVNHLGGMTGGHYVATCKATPCSVDGSEELAHNFNGAGSNGFSVISPESMLDDQSVWRLPGLGKDKDGLTVIQQSRVAANAYARAVSESSEPLWLHFDDDLVEPIPPKAVVSEMAYVLFYRRRELTSSNIVRYSTLD